MSVQDGYYAFDNDLNSILAAINSCYVTVNMAVTEDSPLDMGVVVAAGTYYANGTQVVKGSETDIPLDASDPSLARKDLIVGDSAGTISFVKGTDAAAQPSTSTGPETYSPVPPNIPADKTLLGEVWVGAGVNSINDAAITDRRVFRSPDMALYPQMAQAETITGAWIVDALRRGMAVRNADSPAFTSGSSTGGIQEAHDDLPSRGGMILVGPRLIEYGTAIDATKPCFLWCAGRGIISSNPNAESGASTELKWTGATDAPYMIRFKAADANDYYFGGGLQGVCLNGNDKASVGALLSSTAYTKVNSIHGRGCKVAQIKVDGDNGVLSSFNEFDNIHVTTGAEAATAAAHGILFDGSGSAATTENRVGSIAGLVQNGYMVYLKDADHNIFGKVFGYASGTGGAVYLAGTGNVSWANMFGFVAGDVVAKSGSHGNKILHLTNEGLDFTKIESGADLFFILTDYVIGKQWITPRYELKDSFSLGAGDFISIVGAPSTALFASQWAVWLMDKNATEGLGASFQIPSRWRHGKIEFTLIWSVPTTAAGNVRWRLVADSETTGYPIATPDIDESRTEAVPAQNYILKYDAFGAELEVAAEDTVLLRLERVGGDGADTYDYDVAVIGMKVRFRGRYPEDGNETTGPYFLG